MGVGDWRVCTLAAGQCNESISVTAVPGSTNTGKGQDVSHEFRGLHGFAEITLMLAEKDFTLSMLMNQLS
jgi:hypothetical protein